MFAFCQAVKDHSTETEIIAVDTWKGDNQAGFYDECIFKHVNDVRDTYYSSLKIKLSRKTFDEAVFDFKEKSIDMLHIDGLHTYEAVRHDFENWFPKVKDDGIIIFHDTEVGDFDFGVFRLWEDLKEKFYTIEFHHSFGLGILFLDKEVGKELGKYQSVWQMHYSYIHEIGRNRDILQKDQLLLQKTIEIEAIKSSIFWKVRSFCVKLGRLFFQKKK